jgi:hypothetical protein
MKKLIVDIEQLNEFELDILKEYLTEHDIEFEEVALNPYEEDDSGDVLSDSWLNKADEEYEKNRINNEDNN